MTSLPNKVEEMAGAAIAKVVEPAVQEPPNVPPSAEKSGISAVVAAAQAVEAGLQAQKGKEPTYKPLPAYALQYAPLMWLNKDEQYWPGNPLEHLENCIPQHRNGDLVDIPKDIFGKWPSLELPAVNDEDIFLTLDVDPRKSDRIEILMNTRGKPDPVTRRSDGTCWIIVVDKAQIVGPGVVDVFYFYFYPYNLGNYVVIGNFGNHVGDWEHSMIRFQDGKPIAKHYSAHSLGHAFPWGILEKMGDRPVGYIAKGSHANYPKPGPKFYTPATILGPVDYTNKGILWDPTLNYNASQFDIPTGTFTPLTAPLPTATTTAAPPTPGQAPASGSGPGAGSATPATTPVYDTRVVPEGIVAVLDFKGKWGNSFNDIRVPRGTIGDKIANAGDKLVNSLKIGKKNAPPPAHGRTPSLDLGQQLDILQWSEGPTGPRYKSLERKGMQANTEALSTKLV